MSTQVITHSQERTSAARFGLAWLGWALVAGMAATFFLYLGPELLPLRPGALLLLLAQPLVADCTYRRRVAGAEHGLFQFSSTIRRRFIKAHRWMGRLYLIGVLVGSIGAAYMG